MKVRFLTISIVALTWCFSVFSFADNENQSSNNPYVTIADVTQTFLKAIEIERAEITNNPKLLEEMLTQHLLPYVDYKYAAYKVLGSQFKSVPRDKLPEYMRAFKDYLVVTFATALYQFENYSIKFEHRPSPKEQKIATVRAVISVTGKPDINLALKVRLNKKTGEWKVYDMIAEGISLVSAKRSEVGSVLRQKGIDEVITLLKKNTVVVLEK